MKKLLISGLILFCFLHQSTAQLTVGDVVGKYNAYQALWFKARIHLVFSQDKFSTGDTVFFKAYFLTESLTRVPGKQILDVNLIDHQGKASVHVKFQVNNGLGISQVIIPESIAPGIYYITAHHSWMKNFDSSMLFKKRIEVVNRNEVEELELPFLQVAAEGENLIGGMMNKIGLYSNQIGATVQLRDHSGQEIGRTTIDDLRSASMEFVAATGIGYSVGILNDTVQMSLPAVSADGVRLSLRTDLTYQLIRMSLSSSANSAYRGQELMWLFTSRGKIVYSSVGKHQGEDSLVINTANLPKGIIHCSILDSSGQLLASRDFYNHRDPVKVDIQLHQARVNTREKVQMEVTISDQEGRPMEGEFSLSVINANLLEAESEDTFVDELTLLADRILPYEIDRSQPTWQSSLDHVIIATTRALPWSTILAKTLPEPRYQFTHVLEKRGKAYYAGTNTPLPDLTQISFYLQHSARYVQTFTTDHGTVGFTIPAFYGDDEFYYMAQALNQDDVLDVRVVWDEDKFELPKAPKSKESDRTDAYGVFMQHKRLIDQSYTTLSQDTAPLSGTEPLTNGIWEADIIVPVGDYIVFPTMSELINEVIPAVYYRKTKKGDVVRVQLATPLPVMNSPLYIIDGFATRNTSFFLSLKPAEIKILKIINTRERLQTAGLLGKYGIIIVETHAGDRREPLDDDFKQVKGLQVPLSFNRKSRPSQSLIPDFRFTLYWNPSVKTDASGKAVVEFYTSDDIGKFVLRVHGVTAGAEPFSAGRDMEVTIDQKK